MARHELLEMTHDKWSKDVWNGPLPSDNLHADQTSVVRIDRPKLYFYWGAKDHWVANSTRDSVIAAHARIGEANEDDGRPHMEIDTQGTPHDFCISELTSSPIADADRLTLLQERRVVGW
jgi:hypothetical protein